MDLTVLNKSAETARMSRGRSSSERSASSPTHYNSKSLERPKKQKVTQKVGILCNMNVSEGLLW